MPVPLVSLLPDPALPTDPEQVFDNKVGASLLAQQAMVPEMNTQAEFTNQRAIDADASAQAAANSANSAAGASTKASQWADAAENVEVEPGKFSALHQAIKAAGSATSASSSATTATTKASEASASAATASTKAGEASISATAAANSAAEAAASAASIADGPVASVNGQTGIVLLEPADIAPLATQAEMQAGTEAGIRSMSPQDVAQAISALAGITLLRSARTSNAMLTAADKGQLIDITSGTFTQAFAAASALGNGWFCYLKNSGTGDITIPASDGRTNWIMYPGEVRLFQCDGTALRSVVLNAFYKVFAASGNFIKPPGYAAFRGFLWAGGGGGGRAGAPISAYVGGGGGGGACAPFEIPASAFSETQGFVIGAGGAGQTNIPTTNSESAAGGGDSSIGSFVLAYGGGGGGGALNVNGGGGGGGGTFSAGITSVGSTPGSAGLGGAASAGGGLTGASAEYGGGVGGGGLSMYGGGGGGGGSTSATVRAGGTSRYGGAGGAGCTTGLPPGAGVIPGGGGGGGSANYSGGNGARGELRIWGII